MGVRIRRPKTRESSSQIIKPDCRYVKISLAESGRFVKLAPRDSLQLTKAGKINSLYVGHFASMLYTLRDPPPFGSFLAN